MNDSFPFSAQDCTAAFNRGEVSAQEIVQASLVRIACLNPQLNAYTAVTAERALAEAEALDRARSRNMPSPPFAAVPYAVKNLFDVASLTTLAGARLHAANPPASMDAELVIRLQNAGGMLTGTLNMDAYAYGFTTENTHYGATRNPRDPSRSAGGSSGGTGAAVAGRLVPVGLASDTNGSIRVPASLCGVFGLKPTFGRLSRRGTHPFVASLDHLGPLAGTSTDLAMAYDALQGWDPGDPACVPRRTDPVLPGMDKGVAGLRIARLAGYFDQHAGAEAQWASRTAAHALGATEEVELEGVAEARAAAFLITAAESGALYLDALRERPDEFEPLSRERLTAGALVPAAWYQRAQRLREWYRRQAAKLFAHFDLLIAPATPVTAPLLGQETIRVGGQELPTRPNLGLLTQPISCIGLPVAVAPLWPTGGLPMGVQLIAAPWREDLCLRAAHALEQAGLASSQIREART